MRYIKDLKEGDGVRDIYLCRKKDILKSKTGDDYFALSLGDKTGTVDGKVWTVNSPGIGDFEAGDYINIDGFVKLFNSRPQIIINRLQKANENDIDPADYLPTTTKNIDDMYREIMQYIKSIQNPFLKTLMNSIFIEDKPLAKSISTHTAAKTLHHAFQGGLLEHTLSVTRICEAFSKQYPILNRDLLLSAAMLHDIGKTLELSDLPENDYTDEGQLLGHIYMGAEFVDKRIAAIEGFPKKLRNEVIHCILAHHGELEFGSPKKPALAEAIALSFADNMDAKMEFVTELFNTAASDDGWLGMQKNLESNIRKTGKYV